MRGHEIELPGSTVDQSPGIYRLDPEDVPFAADLLRLCGADLDAPNISAALADVRPITLTPGAIKLLSEADRQQYLHEQAVLGGPDCNYEPII